MRRRVLSRGSKIRPGVRRTSRPAGGRRSLLPAPLSHHLYASNRHRWLQACSIAQRGSALMPRQPSSSAGSGTRGRGACLGVGRPQLLTSCCTFSTVQAASPCQRRGRLASRRGETASPFSSHPAAVSRQVAAASQSASRQVAHAPGVHPAVEVARLLAQQQQLAVNVHVARVGAATATLSAADSAGSSTP